MTPCRRKPNPKTKSAPFRDFFAVLALLTLALAPAAAAAPPMVVASIAPVHSLVAQVMAGVGEPRLLVGGGLSPHAYALKPSDARALAVARLTFWIGPALERFLERPLAALAGDVRVVRLSAAPGLQVLTARKAGPWAEAEDGHGAGDAAHGDHGDHDGIDPHLWLDPVNAARIVEAAVTALAAADPGNAVRYRMNGEKSVAALGALESEIRDTLAPVAAVPYLVFHDAYQYFEKRFDLAAAGAIGVGANRPPGARRIADLRRHIADKDLRCVFVEPQFRPVLAETLTKDTPARIGVLDPLGADLKPGPGLYAELMRGLARSLRDCLQAPPRRG
jgi:zinc transport system substrate-binding protein